MGKFRQQRGPRRQRAGAAGEQVDSLEHVVQVGLGQEREQRLAGRAAVGRYPRAGVQAEFHVVIPAWPSPDPVDEDHVGVVADGQVRGVPGGGGEPLQVRRRDLAQTERSEHRESQVKHADAQPVLAGRVVLVEVAELGERGDVAVRGAAGEAEPLGQFTDSERRAVRAERPENRQSAFERLRRGGIVMRHVPNIRTPY
ncbi:MAG TPA: hypothetical protein VF223_09300 [Trebonia sp.]